MKILYWIATGLLCMLMLYSASMYFRSYAMVSGFFTTLQYPTYLIYPLAIAKLIAVATITFKFSRSLVEWAYAGLFFDLILATTAHINHKDGGYVLPVVGLVCLFTSYLLWKKLFVSHG